MIEFTINERNITFDNIKYAESSLNMVRENMPQINVSELTESDFEAIKSSGISIVETTLPASILKPTQSDIDFTKVQIDIAKYGIDEDFQRTLIVSNDLRILDGHHQHVRWLMLNENKLVNVLMFDKPMSELITYFNEDFGMQGPEAVPGMGPVKMPEVATSPSELISLPKGSGDMPGVLKKKDEDDEKLDENQLTFIDDLLSNLYESLDNSIETDDSVAFKSRANKFLESFGFKYNEAGKLSRYCKDQAGQETWVVAESVDNCKPLDVHFTSDMIESMTDLQICLNKPVKRQFKVIETEFSCQTLEGITIGKAGDCLVVGVDGEVYPCDRKIFDATYQPLPSDEIVKN